MIGGGRGCDVCDVMWRVCHLYVYWVGGLVVSWLFFLWVLLLLLLLRLLFYLTSGVVSFLLFSLCVCIASSRAARILGAFGTARSRFVSLAGLL